MLIGYARVSTSDQDLALQLDALNAAKCEHIATDKASGASINRPGLTEALGMARKGDTLVIWKLDRLGRTMKGLVDLAADLSARGIELRSLTDGIDTATHTGTPALSHPRLDCGNGARTDPGADHGGAGGSPKDRRGWWAQVRPDAPQAGHGDQAARSRRSAARRCGSSRRVRFNILSPFSSQRQKRAG